MFLRVNRKKAKKNPYKAKITFKQNLLPPLLGILAMISAVGILNIQWFLAQLQYDLSSTAIGTGIVNASALNINQNPVIMIPKLEVQAPIIFGVSPYNEAQVQMKLRDGVVHYNTTAKPGQAGNVVIFGHSSGQLWSAGHYKYIFTLLDKLDNGDKIMVDYENVRYIYAVTGRKVIEPTDFTVLKQPANKSLLSLITCTPVGVNKYRLVIEAEQISPKRGYSDQVKLTPRQEKKIWQNIESLSQSSALNSLF